MSQDVDRLKEALASRYPIERELGSGGMATVYLADDVKHSRQVAVKVLRPEVAASLGAERFIREIRIAAQLSHPHILPLFDSGEADGFLYYVMPYVKGESLRDRLTRTGSLPLREVIRLTEQVASALSYAHDQGIIHRDIKPANILLAGDQAIVADFGIAQAVAVAGGARITATGLAVGTPAYMSPEQAFGSGDVGPTSDVYALGCVVYEMMAGRPPFEGATPQAMLARHAAATVPSLRTADGPVPAPVERVVLRALAKSPADRYPTAGGLATALAEASTEEAQRAEAGRVGRRRWIRGALVAGALALLVAGGWWLATRSTPGPIRRLAVLPASNMTRDPEQDYFVDGVHEALVAEMQRAGLAVIARQSVLQYRQTDKPISQIAGELGVDAILLPAVGREGDSVFVDISLYDRQSEVPLWTQSFPAEVRGVLGVYRDVSRTIALELGTVLTASAEARLEERPTIDPRVYEDVLRGRFHLRRFTPQDLTLALQYFESALAIDSTYAPAHVGVASAWGYRAQAGLIPPSEARPHREAHLDRALKLDPQLASARQLEAAGLVWADWDPVAGERAFREAIALDPNDAEMHVFHGHVWMILGRWEKALEEGRLAMNLDPLNQFVVGLYGVILGGTGHNEEAIALLQEMFDRNPGAGFGMSSLSAALNQSGRYEEELTVQRAFYTARGDQEVVAALDSGMAHGGYPEAWRRAADVLAARGKAGFVSPIGVAALYSAAEEAEQAIDWLEIAVTERDQNVPYIAVAPRFQSLHNHPRFRSLVRSVGLPLVEPPRT